MIDRTLKKIPGIIVVAYVLFLFVTSLDAFTAEEALWKMFGMFIVYNIPGMALLFFLSAYWENLVFCGEILLIVSGLLSLCFSPWDKPIAWMMLVLPLLLAAILYLILYYWETHYQFFS